MSRRESCVWHPMPEEVRRSSIQSRRASLAAGRRASAAKDEPDWDVEAAPAAPMQTRAAPAAAEDTYPTEEPAAAQEDTYPTEEPAAAQEDTYPTEEPAAAQEDTYPTEEPAAAQEDTYPTEEPAQAEHEPTPVDEAPVVDQQEPAQAQRELAPVKEEPENVASREPVEDASHEPVQEDAPAAAPAPAPRKNPRAKTRHTIHFRGSKWNEVKDSNPEGLRAAFVKDIEAGAGVEESEATSINFDVNGPMTATFMMYHPREDRSRMEHVHAELQAYAFPNVCALYPPVSDDDEL